MRSVKYYIHILDGRLRIRLGILKSNPTRADALAECLRRLKGIKEVTANPRTGSLLIQYDECQMSRDELLALLGAGAGRPVTNHPAATSPPAGHRIIEQIVIRVVSEIALSLLLGGIGSHRRSWPD